MRNSVVLYPTLRKTTVRRGAEASTRKFVRYAPGELNALEASVALQDRMDAQRSYEDKREEMIALDMRYERMAKVQDAYLRLNWDSRLPYFVTVVSDEDRKNIALLVKAFTSLKGKANMVVLGNVDGRRHIGDNADAFGFIRFTGYIPENEKMRILAGSAGMIFPSFTEGFGIPLTEGAAYEKPVLCSDIEVFREVAGDEAFYFDPYKEDTLVGAVETVLEAPLESAARAKRLKARVLERFTTEATERRVVDFLVGIGLKPQAPERARPAPHSIAS
jgi:glycosyltransferase involved in cell wall biosynthesis